MRSEQLKLHLGHPSPGVWLKEEELPWLFGGSEGLRNGLWETSAQFGNSAKMLLSSQSKVERAEQTMRLTGFTHKCPSEYPTLNWANTPAQLEFLIAAPLWSNSCHDKGESSLWDAKGSSKPEQEEGNHYWNLRRQHITRRPYVWEWPDHHTQYTDFCQINTPDPLAPALLSSGASGTWDPPYPQKDCDGHWAKRKKHWLIPGSGPSPFSSDPIP